MHVARLIALAAALLAQGLHAAPVVTPGSPSRMAPAGAAVPPTPAPLTVTYFSPRGTTKGVRQVSARFVTPMVALGDPRLADPFAVDCRAPGKGRWADPRNWVYDFDADVAGGLRCRFTLKRGLKDLAGHPVTAARPFDFDTGGPAIVRSLPGEGSESVDEDQAFLLKLDGSASADSILAHARCIVEGLAESIPVRLVEGEERKALLAQRRQLGYAYFNLLWKDGWQTQARVRDRAFESAEAQVTVLRCQRRLPPGAMMQLVWGAGVTSTSGVASRQEQRLAFRVRPDFSARIECTRANPQAGCLPFKPIEVRFTSPAPRDLALALRLVAGGATMSPAAADADKSPMLDTIRFDGPFTPSSTVKILLPAGLRDDAGRELSNARRFPVDVRIDEYPPLAKFSGGFGILEAREGGVLPVTLRSMDEPAAGQPSTIPARRLRIGPDAAAIADWLRRVEAASESRGEWIEDAKTGRTRWRELTGADSVFKPADAAVAFDIAKPAGAREFEVVGLPLPGPGLHVVELESRRLGRSLLGADRPRYVATAALVTNLAVHFKWGRESSVVWVTRLDDGKPVPNAAVTISNYCDGSLRWSGRSDRDGLARIDTSFGEPGSSTYCGDRQRKPLLAMAVDGEDFSFALSSWTDGIAPYDFGLQTGDLGSAGLSHTVFDRTLFRPGETVSMKHYLRRHQGTGVAVDEGLPATRKIVVQHLGSDQRYELQASFDAGGIAEQQWTIPPGAKTGDYQVYVADAHGQVRLSGEFKVEDFRLPTMRAEVSGPARPLVQPARVPVDLHVAYLSGGGAGGLPVTLRTYVQPQAPSFRGYEDYQFGGAPVKEGIESLGAGRDASDEEDEEGAGTEGTADQPKVQVLPLALDASGALRVEVGDIPKLASSATLTAELEYPDANGELLTATGRVRLAASAIHLGIRREGWVGTAEQLRFRVVALDLDGKPVPRQDVRVGLYQAAEYSYRKRLIGGFYAYETTRETRKLAGACTGRTDALGLLTCEVAPGVSGQVLLRAEASDAAGHVAGATASAWVVGADDWWFGGTTGDRMDVLPERQEYEAGQKARFQVRMPFRKATALVTVEREGVLQSFVKTLSGREPVVDVPIAANHAPNVFVSVLAVRGRVPRPDGRKAAHDPDAEVTALVDLNKPAFRLGNASIRVGWKPHRLDVQVVPERSVYGVREQARVQVRVRRADGAALPAGSEVALAAVDEGLLELAPNRSWQLLDAMMDPRGLEVWTATAQMQVVGKRHYGRKAVPHGGGGGRDRARQSFDTLLLWQARVPLDANGLASVSIPLNDSLTSFRIVAVASGGAQYFGTGSATLSTTQDLILMSGLPSLVREGDRFLATFTIRNTTNHSLKATLEAAMTPATAEHLASREVELAPGEARDISWAVVAPPGAGQLGWDVRVRKPDGATGDRIGVVQKVISAYPVRPYQATLTQLTAPYSLPVERPAGALPGRGGIDVTLRAKLGDNLDGVRDYMSGYPYTCLEQNLSRAVALGDRRLWDAWMARLPAYLDGAGLLKYFASDALPGEDSLTAYVLTVAHAAGWEIPQAERQRMLDALAGFVAGRIQRDSALPTADLAVRKLAAIAALARYGLANPSMLDSIAIDPSLWPTSAVLDWLDILHRLQGVPSAPTRLAEAENALRARLNFQGTTMGFSTERRDALWWLMISTDSNAARMVLAVVDQPQWRDDVPRLVRGLLGRQLRGHWRTTVANAWGTLALQRFSAVFESTPVTGSTAVALGAAHRDLPWAGAPATHGVSLPWPAQRTNLTVTHAGTGRPWLLVQANAALPLNAPLSSGFTITRTVVAVEQHRPGRWTRGDVVRVRLDLDAQSDATWVVVDDPVPAGATILGSGLGGQSQRLTSTEKRTGYAWPAFEERRFESFRAYYRFVPKGRWTVEYTVRLNNPGTFQLPATRIEAMYAPEMFGERPNPPVTVEAP